MTKDKIIQLVRQYYFENKKPHSMNIVPISGKVFDEEELINLVKASLDGWWTEGKWCKEFSKKLGSYLDINYVILVNSGSSANLLAIKSLTSMKLGERRIIPGDEIITVAAGFPTTINPILEVGAIPVFVDVDVDYYNTSVDRIDKAISKKTKAIILAHTLGNPYDVKKIKKIAENRNIWLVEDNCDALGSKFSGKFTGTFGDLATVSFYPAHHITTAEGGVVITDNPMLKRIITSMRDWGRDCYCKTGYDNTCKKRFDWQLGKLPRGYDHKYIYSEIGYNLKMTDLQAAIGVAQLDKLTKFIKTRKENFNYLYKKMKNFSDLFILPKSLEESDPAWFGFPLTIKNNLIDRTDFLRYLNDNNIATRLLFGGNILKQPYFVDRKIQFKQIGKLENTDLVMKNTFWIGIYPDLNRNNLDYVYKKFCEYL